MKNKTKLNPLSVIDDILNKTIDKAEVVLLALKIAKHNPDLDEVVALMLAQQEWGTSDNRPELLEDGVNVEEYTQHRKKFVINESR